MNKMLNLKKIGITGFLFIQGIILNAQKLELNGNWKYSTKDETSFSSPGFKDADWKDKPADQLFFKKEELDGGTRYTWIRKSIVIPSSLKNQLSKTGALSIFLGRIYQADEFFVNGVLIGKTNSSDIKRAYIINTENIRWDSVNVLALRMRHWGDQSGLENKSAPFIDAALAATIFSLSAAADGVNNKQPVKDKQADYILTVTNNSSKPANAMINASFYDLSNKKLSTDNKTITLKPGSNTFRFPYRSSSAFLKVQYIVDIPQAGYKAYWNDEYGYNAIIYKSVNPVVADKITARFTPADYQQQVIKGWLGERMQANEEKRLYNVDEQAILAGYINKPGDHPWIGEHVGKFLDAAGNTYRNTGDTKLKIQLDRTAQQLIAAQLENGYLGTYTADNYWTSWDVWSHKYNIIGLLNYYSLSGFKPALAAAKKAGDLLCQTFGNNTGQLDIIKAGAHVGMAATSVLEPMVDLYKFSGDKKYLDFCYYIIKSYDQVNGPKIISTLDATGGRTDKTANAKAYEMLSNFVGIIKLYKVTGDDKFLTPILFAWKDIVANRLYITGTASSFEHFKDDDDLPASDKDNMGEGCVTTTWIQLNYQLLCITGEMKYVDELERSVYNHLTGAENPENGAVSYYTPLIGVKPYRSVITCCMSSVPRGISMIPLFANGKINSNPSFLFYQPGTYSTTVADNTRVSYTTVTNFPADGNVSVNVNTGSQTAYAIEFRKPYWAKDFSIAINGKKQPINNTETVSIKRRWEKDDKIDISFTMPTLVLDGGKSYPNQVALQRGPQVLAFDKSINGADINSISVDAKNIQLQKSTMPLPEKWIGDEVFQLKGMENNTEKNIILVPYADASQTGGAITTWIKKESK